MKKKETTKKAVAKCDSNAVGYAVLGATLAGLAATTYFFFGSKGKEHQRHAKAWAIKMKGDVVEKIEAARNVTEPVYHEIIDSVATEYKKGKKASHEEISAIAQDLKKHWKAISGSAKVAKRDFKRIVKKVAKKTESKSKKK